jgi:hypothetical protein
LLAALLENTKSFYSRKVHEWMSLTVSDFLETANLYLGEEKTRITNYYKRFETDVWRQVTEEVIRKSADDLVKNPRSGLVHLLKGDNFKYVKMLYDFLDTIKIEMNTLSTYLMEFIEIKVKEMKENFEVEKEKKEEDPNKLIEQIIEFRAKLMKIASECFNKNKEITNNVNLKMRRELSLINNFPEFLAGYVD